MSNETMNYNVKYINGCGRAESHPIGLSLKAMRTQRHKTQTEASCAVGISRHTLRKYESPIGNIPLTVFVKLVKLYGFDVVDIYHES